MLPAPTKQYKYFDFIMAAFVCIMLCSNVIGAPKVFSVGGMSFGAGILFFPISYLFGDMLTEVYGYAMARRVVWAGFAAMIFASFTSFLVLKLPPANGWNDQAAFETVFGSTWRLVLGSLVAFFCGEFCNSFVLAKLKIKSHGRHLWLRFVLSTIVGEAIDTAIFYPVAFVGLWPTSLLTKVMLSSYIFKVAWEVAVTPFTYLFVNWLKRAENEDHYDHDTNFNPFTLKP
jgi:queuosine precursor transporter